MEPRELFAIARAAGLAVGEAATPRPMIVREAGLFGPTPGGQAWHVPDGVCGFAGIVVKGNTAFGRYAKKIGATHPNYGGGLYISVREYGQSLERKEAFANAFARELNAAGVRAYVNSRMD